MQNRMREATKAAVDQAALEWRAPAATKTVGMHSPANEATPAGGAVHLILKRLRAASGDGHDGDYDAKSFATADDDPSVDVVAEAKRTMKRARESDDCQRHDATKWRTLAAAFVCESVHTSNE